MRNITLLGLGIAIGLCALAMPGTAFAAQPVDWQMGFQPAASPTMDKIDDFHNLMLWIITAIVTFVLLLLVVVMVRFNRRSNPNPSKNTHNTMLEVVWTIVPVLILVVIATQSFPLLYYSERVPEADVTVKATGYQWYWGYSYPDEFGDEEFLANMCDETITDGDCAAGHPRLLGTTFDMVVPVNKNVRVLVTAADVIHSWAMPALGVKMDGVPGRLNETWFRAEKEGMYYGQCSELCGIRHAFMPIAVRVVSQAEYEQWKQSVRTEYGLAQAPEAGASGDAVAAPVPAASAPSKLTLTRTAEVRPGAPARVAE